MSEWKPVCTPDEVVEGQMLLTPHGDGVVLTRFNGQIYAFDDICTHEWCQLSDGRLDEDEVVCQCHGSVFSVTTGAVLLGPAAEPIRTYPVREVGNYVEILLEGYQPR